MPFGLRGQRRSDGGDRRVAQSLSGVLRTGDGRSVDMGDQHQPFGTCWCHQHRLTADEVVCQVTGYCIVAALVGLWVIKSRYCFDIGYKLQGSAWKLVMGHCSVGVCMGERVRMQKQTYTKFLSMDDMC